MVPESACIPIPSEATVFFMAALIVAGIVYLIVRSRCRRAIPEAA